jgi:2-hydroxychromene-2-carboxylate isomerase
LLGGVFKQAGNTPPASVPAKARYLLADLLRWSRHYGVPFRMSSHFPLNTLRPMRACTFAHTRGRDHDFALALFRAYWVDDTDITRDEPITAAAHIAGLDPQEVLAACENPEIKDALRKNTEEAFARGAFGAPTFFVGEELFWGNDRMDFVEDALKR